MPKRITALAVVVLTVFTPPVYALSSSSSLKSALVEYLYQYGKEMFYRGVNPQEASFVFQRALVLDCHHQGAQDFLNRLHHKYPDVSVRVWGCADEPLAAETESTENTLRNARTSITEKLPDEESKARALKREVAKAEHQMNAGEIRPSAKIVVPAPQAIEDKSEERPAEDLSYSNIANDQKDLIRIQQGNIDYLKSELAEAKKQMKTGASPDAYAKTQAELADAGLEAQERKMETESKDAESRTLKQQLNDLQEQLALVQKIVDEKNRTIESLQKEARPSDLAGQ